MQMILGYTGSVISVSLVCFYVAGWIFFDGQTWRQVFTSGIGLGLTVGFGAIAICFWGWMTKHCVSDRRDLPRGWIVFLLLGFHVAATAYFLIVYRQKVEPQ